MASGDVASGGGQVCDTRPFNHIMFLLAPIGGGAFCFVMTLAGVGIPGTSPGAWWARIVLGLLEGVVVIGLFVGFLRHLKAYKTHSRSGHKPSEFEKTGALAIHFFLLGFWAVLIGLAIFLRTGWLKFDLPPLELKAPPGISTPLKK